jgi:molybdopterin converting factor small subunit
VRVEVQLHATLTAFLPPGSRDGVAVFDVAATATVADLIRHLGIPADLSRVVLVNGHDVDEETLLRVGDVVDIFPPLAGGSEPRWYTREVREEAARTLEASRNPVGLPDFKSGVRL